MTFVPHTDILLHSASPDVDAHHWLKALCTDLDRAEGPTLPSAEYPRFIPPKTPRMPFAGGTFQPRSLCPKTGRSLFLHLFRDSTGLILRESANEDSGWDVLPAAFTLVRENHDKILLDIPFNERPAHMALLRIQAESEGVSWEIQPAPDGGTIDLDQDGVSRLLSAAITQRAGEVLDAPGLSDPRYTARAPQGTRFAPFSPQRSRDLVSDEIDRVRRIITAEAQVAMYRDGRISDFHLWAVPSKPQTPWLGKSDLQVHMTPPNLALSKHLRRRFLDPDHGLSPAALRHPMAATLHWDITRHETAHELLEAMRLVNGLGDQ